MSPSVTLYGTYSARLGESPLWDPRSRRLYWVDSVAPLILSANADGGDEQRWAMPATIGSIALSEHGLVAALADGFYAFDPANGALKPLALPERGNTHVRFNDGKADRQGRFLAGTMRHAGGEGAPGKLYRLDQSGASVIEQDIMVANGLCFSPDGATMYFADSMQGRIWAYDYDDDGARNRRVFLDTAGLGSAPDGATVDAEGHLWVALVQGQKLVRVGPDGSVVAEIVTPMPYPSCPAFGGDDLSTLYVTSLRDTGGAFKTDHPEGGRMLAITNLPAPGIAEAICIHFPAEETAS